MQVDTLDGNAWSSATTQLQRNHMVQDVFSQILLEVGRQGYASAEAVSEEVPLTDQVSDSWSCWFGGEYRDGRYLGEADAENMKQMYGEILLRAYQEGAYTDPTTFLKTRSQEELSVVQGIHRLAGPIQVDNLSEEGAINLLLPPAAQVDMNHDGLTRCGVAYGMKFPNSNTPPEVVKAWETATADMEPEELVVHEMQMMLPLLTANLVCDENGQFLHWYEPGDPEFQNPMASPNYSYVQQTEDCLEYLEKFRMHISSEQYERNKSFLTTFHDLLIEYGAQ